MVVFVVVFAVDAGDGVGDGDCLPIKASRSFDNCSAVMGPFVVPDVEDVDADGDGVGFAAGVSPKTLMPMVGRE